VTGVELPWWVVEALADHRNIVGIKDSSGNMPYFMTLIEKLKDKFYILCGHDEIATSALLSGADGVILASANILPDIWVNIYSSIVAGKVDMALELQRRIQTIVRLIVKGGPVAVKSALNMIGIDAGGSRIPLIRGGRYRYEDEDLLRHHLFKLGKIAKKKIKIVSDGAEFDHEYPAISYTPPTLSSFEIKVGESFTSPGTVDLAHIDLIIGYRNGPVGAAFDKALNEKLAGHEPQVVKYEGMDVEPITILIPTVRVVNEVHHNLIYKYASRGIARAILECVEDGYIPHKLKDKLCIIAHVFVHPEATNRRRIEINNYKAMLNALIRAIENRPCIEELEELYRYSRHPFRYTP
jgi:formaldehyde-activating enzyme